MFLSPLLLFKFGFVVLFFFFPGTNASLERTDSPVRTSTKPDRFNTEKGNNLSASLLLFEAAPCRAFLWQWSTDDKSCTYWSLSWAGHSWGSSPAGGLLSLVVFSFCLGLHPKSCGCKEQLSCCRASAARVQAALNKEQGCSRRRCSLTLSHLNPRGVRGQESVLGAGMRLAECLACCRLAVERREGAAVCEHWLRQLGVEAGSWSGPFQPYNNPALSTAGQDVTAS